MRPEKIQWLMMILVSEGLNSVETLSPQAFLHSFYFSVSEGLNSVETATLHLLHISIPPFQKDLIVWKPEEERDAIEKYN